MKYDTKFDNESLLVAESVLTTANGYLGVRGNFEEGYGEGLESIRGTYLNGFYDIVDVTYGENAYGFPQTAQKMLNVIDGQTIRISVGGDVFSMDSGKILSMKRSLNLEAGYAARSIHWQSPKNHEIIIDIRRMTSFKTKELLMIDYNVRSIGYNGPLTIESTIDGNVRNYTRAGDPRVASGHGQLLEITSAFTDIQTGILTAKTTRSGLEMACMMLHDIPMQLFIEDNTITATRTLQLDDNDECHFTKYVVYTDSLRHDHIIDSGLDIIGMVADKGRVYWYNRQQHYLDDFWKYAKVDIEGDDSVQEAIDFSCYQLLACAGKEPYSNMAAKGLTGEGYEGHYFWDTEIYAIPFFTLTEPEVAKNLLTFRHRTLDQARIRAVELGHKKGAKIPWRTISGSECSGYFPAACAQYHINADVAYANIQYYLFHKDLDFMMTISYPVIFETARLWMDTGHYGPDGMFRIDDVTGPDEYTAIVNNNYYTNAMAKYHLMWAVKLATVLEEYDMDGWNRLCDELDISTNELYSMKQAAEAMYLPYDQAHGISLMDDSFMLKKDWDFDGTPKDHHPLLLYYHPLAIYRHKVLKQADTVLAHFLLDNEKGSVMKRSYDYYERYTTHDSSLSYCIYGMMASKVGYPEKALHYFNKNIRLDLDNLHHNTKDGLHLANAGGVYMNLVYGFMGLRIKEDGLYLAPTKPTCWNSLTIRFRYKGTLLTLSIANDIVIESQEPVTLYLYGTSYNVKDRPLHVPVATKTIS